jgi:putative transcriptional regulator
MRRIRFYLRTLIAEYSDRTGERLTYSDLYEKTGVSTNTLSHMVNNVQQMVALNVLERLCDFFDCELHDLMRLEPADEHTD